jgi:hypothetical protein
MRYRLCLGSACFEDVVHDFGACGDDGAELSAVDNLGGRRSRCPCGGVACESGDFLGADAWWLMRLTNEVRSSRGVQASPAPAATHIRLNIVRTLAGSRAAPCWVVNGLGFEAIVDSSDRHSAAVARRASA